MDVDPLTAKMLASEPEITINGIALTPSQSMAVRVGVTNFHFEMMEPGVLGDDEVGQGIQNGYRDRLTEVLRIMSFKREG